MRILYVTGASFAESNAAALRNLGLASAIARAGHDVVIASSDVDDGKVLASWFPEFPRGVQLRAVGAPLDAGNAASRPARVGSRSLLSHPGLPLLVSDWSPDVIILYQSFLPLLVSIRRLARKSATPVVVDLTEWYDGSSLPYGAFGPHNMLNQLSMRAVVPRLPHLIAVSEGLAEHSSRLGARTLVVPPLFEPATLRSLAKTHRGESGRLRIAVTGSGITPGQKDRAGLLAIASVISSIDPDALRIEVHVAGPTRGAVETALGHAAPRGMIFHGPLPWSRSLELVANCDFTLMLRDESSRRNRLGFPSKVPESLILGTPILGNIVGDLKYYLVDGQNAAIVKDPTARALRGAIEGVLEGLGLWDRDQIHRQAVKFFAPEAHAQRLDRFLASSRTST